MRDKYNNCKSQNCPCHSIHDADFNHCCELCKADEHWGINEAHELAGGLTEPSF